MDNSHFQAKILEKFQPHKDKSLVRKEILSSLLNTEASNPSAHTFVCEEAYEQFTGTTSYHLLGSGTNFSATNHLEYRKYLISSTALSAVPIFSQTHHVPKKKKSKLAIHNILQILSFLAPRVKRLQNSI